MFNTCSCLEASSPRCPPPAIPKAETTSPPRKMLRQSSSEKLRDALPRCCSHAGEAQQICTGRRHLETALHLLWLGPVPKGQDTTQLLTVKQLPSSARANSAPSEIPFHGLTCQEGKLASSKYTHKALSSLVKTFGGNGGWQISLPSLKGAEGMPQPCSLPLLLTLLPEQKSHVNSFHSKSKVVRGISPTPETFHSMCLSPHFSSHTMISSLRTGGGSSFYFAKVNRLRSDKEYFKVRGFTQASLKNVRHARGFCIAWPGRPALVCRWWSYSL